MVISDPTDEQLVLWAVTGHKATHTTSSWYCRRAYDDAGHSAYGGWCVLSASSPTHIYNHPARGIATSPSLYLVAFFDLWIDPGDAKNTNGPPQTRLERGRWKH
jgi:hypothetical protein